MLADYHRAFIKTTHQICVILKYKPLLGQWNRHDLAKGRMQPNTQNLKPKPGRLTKNPHK